MAFSPLRLISPSAMQVGILETLSNVLPVPKKENSPPSLHLDRPGTDVTIGCMITETGMTCDRSRRASSSALEACSSSAAPPPTHSSSHFNRIFVQPNLQASACSSFSKEKENVSKSCLRRSARTLNDGVESCLRGPYRSHDAAVERLITFGSGRFSHPSSPPLHSLSANGGPGCSGLYCGCSHSYFSSGSSHGFANQKHKQNSPHKVSLSHNPVRRKSNPLHDVLKFHTSQSKSPPPALTTDKGATAVKNDLDSYISQHKELIGHDQDAELTNKNSLDPSLQRMASDISRRLSEELIALSITDSQPTTKPLAKAVAIALRRQQQTERLLMRHMRRYGFISPLRNLLSSYRRNLHLGNRIHRFRRARSKSSSKLVGSMCVASQGVDSNSTDADDEFDEDFGNIEDKDSELALLHLCLDQALYVSPSREVTPKLSSHQYTLATLRPKTGVSGEERESGYGASATSSLVHPSDDPDDQGAIERPSSSKAKRSDELHCDSKLHQECGGCGTPTASTTATRSSSRTTSSRSLSTSNDALTGIELNYYDTLVPTGEPVILHHPLLASCQSFNPHLYPDSPSCIGTTVQLGDGGVPGTQTGRRNSQRRHRVRILDEHKPSNLTSSRWEEVSKVQPASVLTHALDTALRCQHVDSGELGHDQTTKGDRRSHLKTIKKGDQYEYPINDEELGGTGQYSLSLGVKEAFTKAVERLRRRRFYLTGSASGRSIPISSAACLTNKRAPDAFRNLSANQYDAGSAVVANQGNEIEYDEDEEDRLSLDATSLHSIVGGPPERWPSNHLLPKASLDSNGLDLLSQNISNLQSPLHGISPSTLTSACCLTSPQSHLHPTSIANASQPQTALASPSFTSPVDNPSIAWTSLISPPSSSLILVSDSNDHKALSGQKVSSCSNFSPEPSIANQASTKPCSTLSSTIVSAPVAVMAPIFVPPLRQHLFTPTFYTLPQHHQSTQNIPFPVPFYGASITTGAVSLLNRFNSAPLPVPSETCSDSTYLASAFHSVCGASRSLMSYTPTGNLLSPTIQSNMPALSAHVTLTNSINANLSSHTLLPACEAAVGDLTPTYQLQSCPPLTSPLTLKPASIHNAIVPLCHIPAAYAKVGLGAGSNGRSADVKEDPVETQNAELVSYTGLSRFDLPQQQQNMHAALKKNIDRMSERDEEDRTKTCVPETRQQFINCLPDFLQVAIPASRHSPSLLTTICPQLISMSSNAPSITHLWPSQPLQLSTTYSAHLKQSSPRVEADPDDNLSTVVSTASCLPFNKFNRSSTKMSTMSSWSSPPPPAFQSSIPQSSQPFSSELPFTAIGKQLLNPPKESTPSPVLASPLLPSASGVPIKSPHCQPNHQPRSQSAMEHRRRYSISADPRYVVNLASAPIVDKNGKLVRRSPRVSLLVDGVRFLLDLSALQTHPNTMLGRMFSTPFAALSNHGPLFDSVSPAAVPDRLSSIANNSGGYLKHQCQHQTSADSNSHCNSEQNSPGDVSSPLLGQRRATEVVNFHSFEDTLKDESSAPDCLALEPSLYCPQSSFNQLQEPSSPPVAASTAAATSSVSFSLPSDLPVALGTGITAGVFRAVLDYYVHPDHLMTCPQGVPIHELKAACDYLLVPFSHETVRCSNLRKFKTGKSFTGLDFY
ncbi:unnamed protein product [Protopolystoma xenopodis]|uniref:BTBD10/KCTD20 BTB/POZ domain-containing protein n=1 Tax=Protopolystoma xenopodis TaxID=117903 RepID=A0A448WAM9_9PLAT|nr:unnamed protein product [Protopolystoma xenopodis]